MKTAILLLAFGSLAAACKKAPLKNYTIQGRIYISYPKMPFARQAITVTVTKGSNDSYQSQNLGYATTDDSGYFSVTYTETNITGTDPSGGPNAQIHIDGGMLSFDGLPVNQNINKDFYLVYFGKLQIYLQTNNPLETNHDTFFLGHFAGSNLILDTVLHTINGLYKTSTLPVGGYTLFYGRGWKDLHYDASVNGFNYKSHHIDVHIDGDPTIDKITINY